MVTPAMVMWVTTSVYTSTRHAGGVEEAVVSSQTKGR